MVYGGAERGQTMVGFVWLAVSIPTLEVYAILCMADNFSFPVGKNRVPGVGFGSSYNILMSSWAAVLSEDSCFIFP